MAMKRSAFWRYTAFQIPGWILVTIVGWWLYRTLDIPVWAAAGVLVIWVIKDFTLYPFLRSSFELDYTMPVERLVGKRGRATQPLAPTGFVRVHGELWRAEAEEDNTVITQGDEVEITGVNGIRLIARLVDARS